MYFRRQQPHLNSNLSSMIHSLHITELWNNNNSIAMQPGYTSSPTTPTTPLLLLMLLQAESDHNDFIFYFATDARKSKKKKKKKKIQLWISNTADEVQDVIHDVKCRIMLGTAM